MRMREGQKDRRNKNLAGGGGGGDSATSCFFRTKILAQKLLPEWRNVDWKSGIRPRQCHQHIYIRTYPD